MITREESIQKMFDKILIFCPDGICPFCKADILKGVVVNEKTEVITGCPNVKCKRSFVD